MGRQRDFNDIRALARRLFASPPRLKVLLVEPDRAAAEALAAALPKGSHVRIVGTVAAARAAMDADLPTIVAAELHLPDGSGLELLASARIHPRTQHVLLMALSTQASVRAKIDTFEAGIDDYLVKPIEPATFALHVRQLSHFRQTLPRGSDA